MLMHAERRRMLDSPARHRVVAAGRRSGKTEDAKRIVIAGDKHHSSCLEPPNVPNPLFGIAAPTRDQVKRIWWEDVKAMSPPWAIVAISEADLWIRYVTGSVLRLIGLDKPQRAEGDPLDGLVVDECAEIKETAWSNSLRPMLDNRGRPPGWSLRIGRPKGRNHFFKWWSEAKELPDSDSFQWFSSLILSKDKIEAARRDLDPRTFAQEYEACFLTQQGRVCTEYDANKHLRPVTYDPQLDLVLALDFNVSPGSAVVIQEQPLTPWDSPNADPRMHTAVVGEIHIADDSTTRLVCERFAARYAGHKRAVLVYGDTSGNDRHTSAESNDYAQVLQLLRRSFPDVRLRVPRSKPPIIDSVNSVNTRMQSADGTVRFAISPKAAPQTLLDIEGVTWEEGPDRDIDKSNDKRTHWLDALRYYIHEAHPLGGSIVRSH
jgi:hypothetical protein